jgi:hypothetical protein
MVRVPKSYHIGNYANIGSVQHARPLVYGNNNKKEGELISGLKD